MQTFIDARFKDTEAGREAEAILRSCVHCGFCNATCPTYQLTGDERDGPRGRIYLIKQALEGREVSVRTQRHLDRCLTCRACETTCPSGVQYGRLAEIGREIVDAQVRRPSDQRLLRRLLRLVLPYPERFALALRLGRALRFALPGALRRKIPAAHAPGPRPPARHARTVVLHEGCVQPAATPRTNAAAARVLDRLNISAMSQRGQGCCGAISYHTGAHEEGLDFMRRNVDAWWPQVEAGAEAIVSAASACSLMVKEYGRALKDDPAYARRAARVSELAADLSEVVAREDYATLAGTVQPRRAAFHAPCTLQHGQRRAGAVEAMLSAAGHELLPVADAHLCCGSAGTYSVLQPAMSGRLLADKVAALEAGGPEVIATANVGCQLHLQTAADVPVVHWIELLDPARA
mgnify:CR=1 FL=1